MRGHHSPSPRGSAAEPLLCLVNAVHMVSIAFTHTVSPVGSLRLDPSCLSNQLCSFLVHGSVRRSAAPFPCPLGAGGRKLGALGAEVQEQEDLCSTPCSGPALSPTYALGLVRMKTNYAPCYFGQSGIGAFSCILLPCCFALGWEQDGDIASYMGGFAAGRGPGAECMLAAFGCKIRK